MSDDLAATTLPEIVPDTSVAVQENAPNTLVDPHDPVDVSFASWFSSSNFPVCAGNEIIPYIQGEDFYSDLRAAWASTTTSEHFIYILAWGLLEFNLVDGDNSTSVQQLLEDASKTRNVQIRAMLFKQPQAFNSRDNAPMVSFINGLPTGAAIFDERALEIQSQLLGVLAQAFLGSSIVGAHHQKIIVVYGEDGLITFQGGMDPDANRREPGALHDVHTRVRGPIAYHLYKTFVGRWADHPDSKSLRGTKRIGQSPALSLKRPLFAAVTRTFGNMSAHSTVPGGYAFAPNGEHGVNAQLKTAIAKATRFVYVEDQYLVSMDLAGALGMAAKRGVTIILLICDSGAVQPELYQTDTRRKEFLAAIGTFNHPTGKLWVATSSRYIHAKLLIVDDRVAVVGSANMNRRGQTHDSEQAVTIFDTNVAKRWFWAHELRMNLWAKHLGGAPIDYVDPIASTVHWQAATGTISPFILKLVDKDPPIGFSPDEFWDLVIDPDGS